MKGQLQFDLRRNHGIAGVVAAASTMAVVAALAFAAPAFAQISPDAPPESANSADAIAPSANFAPAAPEVGPSVTFAPAAGAAIAAPDSGYALPPPNDGPLADPAPSAATAEGRNDHSSATDEVSAAAPTTDGTTGAALPDGAPSEPAAPGGGVAALAAADRDSRPASHSGWQRVGESGDGESDDNSGDSGSQVLEVPRALPSPDASSGDGGNQAGDSSPPDEVGNVDDYQDEQDNPMAVYIGPAIGPPLLNPPFSAGTFGNQPPAALPAQPSYGPMFPTGIGGVRPFVDGMNSAILPTSPMYPRGVPMTQSYRRMVPRSAAPLAGGWWNRAR